MDIKGILKALRLNEEKVSFFLGVLAIFLVVALLVNYFNSVNRENTSSTATAIEATETAQGEIKSLDAASTVTLPAEYEIKAGDSLWKISDKVYGSGYSWTAIYEANKQVISNPSVIRVGTKITIPKVESVKTIEHTVVKGDTVWDIAQTYCGDGFAWQAIATENKLENARLITPGMVLRVRCR